MCWGNPRWEAGRSHGWLAGSITHDASMGMVYLDLDLPCHKNQANVGKYVMHGCNLWVYLFGMRFIRSICGFGDLSDDL